MRITVAFLLLFTASLQAQTFEIGGYFGGANAIGDVGKTNYIDPEGLAFGALFKWNKSKRYAWRASVTRANLIFNDNLSSLESRRTRGYRVNNTILEYSAGLEFHFWEYNLHKLGPAYTPYLYTGVTYFRYDYNYIDGTPPDELRLTGQREGSFAIPMVVGGKVRINQFLILAAEIGARYTLTDNLDASNPEGSNFESFRFGNFFSDDWYVFSGVSLTYTFGRKPCQDCFE